MNSRILSASCPSDRGEGEAPAQGSGTPTFASGTAAPSLSGPCELSASSLCPPGSVRRRRGNEREGKRKKRKQGRRDSTGLGNNEVMRERKRTGKKDERMSKGETGKVPDSEANMR